MTTEKTNEVPAGAGGCSAPTACSGLSVGTRLMLTFGHGATHATVVAVMNGRYGVTLACRRNDLDIYTLEELEQHKYIVLPQKPKKQSWLGKLLAPNDKLCREQGGKD